MSDGINLEKRGTTDSMEEGLKYLGKAVYFKITGEWEHNDRSIKIDGYPPIDSINWPVLEIMLSREKDPSTKMVEEKIKKVEREFKINISLPNSINGFIMTYKPPILEKETFNCPYCQDFAHQTWYDGVKWGSNGFEGSLENFRISCCSYCNNHTFWINDKVIYPEVIGIPNPNEDLEKEIQNDYFEAAGIVNKSPRGAAALLRLAIQKLCKQLGEKGENINDDIACLVKKKNLSVKIQQALDTVRVVGNEAVHPGEINLNDNVEVAIKLFELLNIIAQTMITQPKDIEKLYNGLPKEKLDGIKARDSK